MGIITEPNRTDFICTVSDLGIPAIFPDLAKEKTMGEMLQQGDRFPSLTLKTVDGRTLKIPDDITSRYAAVLFYRGHW